MAPPIRPTTVPFSPEPHLESGLNERPGLARRAPMDSEQVDGVVVLTGERLKLAQGVDFPRLYPQVLQYLKQFVPKEGEISTGAEVFMERIRRELCVDHELIDEGSMVELFLLKHFTNVRDLEAIRAHPDYLNVVRLLVVHVQRFINRIPGYAYRLKWAGERVEGKAPFLAPRFYPEATVVRMDLKNSVATRQARGPNMVRATETFYFNRLAEEMRRVPGAIHVKSAGDEATFVCPDSATAELLVAAVQSCAVLEDGEFSIEVGIAANGPVILMPTAEGRFVIAGEAYRKAEEVQKLSKGRDAYTMRGAAGIWKYDFRTGRPPEPLDHLVDFGRSSHLSATGTFQSEMSWQGIPVLTTLELSEAEMQDDSPEKNFSDAMAPYRFDLDLSKASLVDQLLPRMAYAAESVRPLQAEAMIRVQAGILNVKFDPPADPVDPADPFQLMAYYRAWEALLSPVEDLLNRYGLSQVYLDSAGILIVGAGIYGASPLNLEERLAHFQMDLLGLDFVRYSSQTLGRVAQGPMAGSENIAGACIDLSARFQKPKYRTTSSGVEAPIILDEATYEALMARGVGVVVLERRDEVVDGFEVSGPKTFYLCSGIEFHRQSERPKGYEAQFEGVHAILKSCLSEGEATPLRRFHSALMRLDATMGGDQFLTSTGDEARLLGYTTLGEYMPVHLTRSYEWIRFILKQMFGGDEHRFSHFVQEHDLGDPDLLILFFNALTQSGHGLKDIAQYGDLVVTRLVEVFRVYSQANPICLFIPERDRLDDESRKVVDALERDKGDTGGMVLFEVQQVAGDFGREMTFGTGTFFDMGVLNSGEVSVVSDRWTVQAPIEVVGIWPGRGFDLLKEFLNGDDVVDTVEIDESVRAFYISLLGNQQWSPFQFESLTQALHKGGYFVEGSGEFAGAPRVQDFREVLSFESIVRLKLSSLSSEALQVFNVACFMEGHSSEMVLKYCLGAFSEEGFDSVKEELEQAGLLEFRANNFHFVQPFFREEGRSMLMVDDSVGAVWAGTILDSMMKVPDAAISPEALLRQAKAAQVPQRILPKLYSMLQSMAPTDPVIAESVFLQSLKTIHHQAREFASYTPEESLAFAQILSTLIQVGFTLHNSEEQVQPLRRLFDSCVIDIKRAYPELDGMLRAERGVLMCTLGFEQTNPEFLRQGLPLIGPLTPHYRDQHDFFEAALISFQAKEERSFDKMLVARAQLKQLCDRAGVDFVLARESARMMISCEGFLVTFGHERVLAEGIDFQKNVAQFFADYPTLPMSAKSKIAQQVARFKCMQGDFGSASTMLADQSQEAYSQGQIGAKIGFDSLRATVLGMQAQGLFEVFHDHGDVSVRDRAVAAIAEFETFTNELMSRSRELMRPTKYFLVFLKNIIELNYWKYCLNDDETERARYRNRAQMVRTLMTTQCSPDHLKHYHKDVEEADYFLRKMGA